jgi:hypothetical protein
MELIGYHRISGKSSKSPQSAARKVYNILTLLPNTYVSVIKIKSGIFPIHDINAYMKSGDLEVRLHSFLTLAPDGDELAASSPDRFTSVEIIPQYTLDKRLYGPQRRSGRTGEEINFFLYQGSNYGSSNPVAYSL